MTNGCDVYDQMRNLQYCFWGLSQTNPNLHYVNTYLLDNVKQIIIILSWTPIGDKELSYMYQWKIPCSATIALVTRYLMKTCRVVHEHLWQYNCLNLLLDHTPYIDSELITCNSTLIYCRNC